MTELSRVFPLEKDIVFVRMTIDELLAYPTLPAKTLARVGVVPLTEAGKRDAPKIRMLMVLDKAMQDVADKTPTGLKDQCAYLFGQRPVTQDMLEQMREIAKEYQVDVIFFDLYLLEPDGVVQ